jgi:hypothetical protein
VRDYKLEMLLISGFMQYANDAQQAFSSVSAPSLQNALPALERLHAAWEKASNKSRYTPFIPALEAGMQKLNQYYQRSAQSDAHIMAMGKISILTCVAY